MRIDAGIIQSDLTTADVTTSAWRSDFLEIAKQHLPSAPHRFAQARQRAQPLPLEGAAVLIDVLFINLPPPESNILDPVQRQGSGIQTIAPRPADLLIISLDGCRHIGMHDKAHIGLVDPHAESDSGHGNHPVFAQETVLIGVAGRQIQTGMIGHRLIALLLQIARQCLGLFARGAIDDAAVPAVLRQKINQLPARIVFRFEAQIDIGAVERMDENLRLG